MRFVLDYRAMFQSNNDIHALGDSRTGIYTYQVWLFKVPLVLTVDLTAKWNPQEAWIQANSCDIFLQGPSWEEETTLT